VALYKTGEFEFPPISMSLRSPEGKEILFSSPAVKVQIQSVLKSDDQNLKELKRQAEIKEPVRWLLWLTLACLFILLLAIAAAFWQRRRRRPAVFQSAVPQIDPLELAESELRDLLGRGLLEKGFIKQFYIALSEIVRRVVEAGYGIHTLEMTTSEIMEDLRADSKNHDGKENLARIESVLTLCDFAKFAKYLPSQRESEEAIRNAHQILSVIREQKTPPPPSEAASVAGVS
jgi:hypothetical protein